MHAVGIQPDGTNINAGVGSLHPDSVAAVVRETGADVGIALDGDADRVVLVDASGEAVDGDAVLALAALDRKRKGELAHDTLVATQMSNLGLERALAAEGIRLVRTQVGDRYVVEEMRRGGFNLGGESSGHVVFLDHATTGDGLLTALQVLAILVETGRPLAELAAVMHRVPQTLHNVRVRRSETGPLDLDAIEPVQRSIRQVEDALGSEGRILVRPSGTEPLVRVMIEGDHPEIESMARDVGRAIEKALG